MKRSRRSFRQVGRIPEVERPAARVVYDGVLDRLGYLARAAANAARRRSKAGSYSSLRTQSSRLILRRLPQPQPQAAPWRKLERRVARDASSAIMTPLLLAPRMIIAGTLKEARGASELQPGQTAGAA